MASHLLAQVVQNEEASKQIIDLLFNNGADARHKFENTPVLVLAAFSNNMTAVRALLEKGALVDSYDDDGDTALHIAAQRCNVAIMRTLIHHRANPNALNYSGYTPLHYATSLAAVTCLVDVQGIELNIKNEDQETPLDIALEDYNEMEGDAAIVQLLKSKGAVFGKDIDSSNASIPFIAEPTN
jgi:ankyrin repeat protein